MASVGSLAQHSARRCPLAVRAYLLGRLLVPSTTSNRDIVWFFFLAGMALSSVAAPGLLGVCPFEHPRFPIIMVGNVLCRTDVRLSFLCPLP